MHSGEHMYRALTITVAMTLILAYCRSRQDADASDSAVDTVILATTDTAARARRDIAARPRADTATAGADTAMVPPTALGKVVSQMMESMETHMRVMDTASAATMKARLARHNQMAGNMISRMNEEVRTMKIATDAIWPATVDSVRQDLTRMEAMAGADIKAVMPAHLARMRWLIQMQGTMTGKTPP